MIRCNWVPLARTTLNLQVVGKILCILYWSHWAAVILISFSIASKIKEYDGEVKKEEKYKVKIKA